MQLDNGTDREKAQGTTRYKFKRAACSKMKRIIINENREKQKLGYKYA